MSRKRRGPGYHGGPVARDRSPLRPRKSAQTSSELFPDFQRTQQSRREASQGLRELLPDFQRTQQSRREASQGQQNAPPPRGLFPSHWNSTPRRSQSPSRDSQSPSRRHRSPVGQERRDAIPRSRQPPASQEPVRSNPNTEPVGHQRSARPQGSLKGSTKNKPITTGQPSQSSTSASATHGLPSSNLASGDHPNTQTLPPPGNATGGTASCDSLDPSAITAKKRGRTDESDTVPEKRQKTSSGHTPNPKPVLTTPPPTSSPESRSESKSPQGQDPHLESPVINPILTNSEEVFDASAAFRYLADFDHQQRLVEMYGKGALNLGRSLQKAFQKQFKSGKFSGKDGWIKDADFSREQGRLEVGMIIEFPMPVFRGDPNAPRDDDPNWIHGPDGHIVMIKMTIGIVTWNGHCKTIKWFTTKRKTNPKRLRESGDLKHYVQIIRSPEEDDVILEEGTFAVLRFKADCKHDEKLNIQRSRFMETMGGDYQMPHCMPYKPLGDLKDRRDEEIFRQILLAEAAIRINAASYAEEQRSSNPDWMKRYRDAVKLEGMGDNTLVEKTREPPLAKDDETQMPVAPRSSEERGSNEAGNDDVAYFKKRGETDDALAAAMKKDVGFK